MNLYELLHDDHERVKRLFREIEATAEIENTRREQLFSTLYREMDLHSQAEEKFFYPRLKNEEETRGIILESFDEHKHIKKLLDDLDTMDKGSPEWTAKLRTLRESVDNHVREEEYELFPRAKMVLDDDESDGISDDIETFKEEHTELESY